MRYALIDCTNYKALATCDTYAALTALAYIQFANVDTVVFPLSENRPWSQFTADQLENIFNDVVDVAAINGQAFKTGTYSDIIGKARSMVEAAEFLYLPPRIANKLDAQAQAIPPGSDQPFMINLNGTAPIPQKRWSVDPQRNRHRYATAESPVLTERRAAPAPSASLDGAESLQQPARKRAPAPPGGAQATPRVPRIALASGKGTRPAPGSTTGKVWDAADAAAKSAKDEIGSKDFRKRVINACTLQGINPSTASVQYGAWLKAQGSE